jgi:hypothetical protein
MPGGVGGAAPKGPPYPDLRPTLVIYQCSAVCPKGRLEPSVAVRGMSPDGSLVELTDLPDPGLTSTGAAGDIGFGTVELHAGDSGARN